MMYCWCRRLSARHLMIILGCIQSGCFLNPNNFKLDSDYRQPRDSYPQYYVVSTYCDIYYISRIYIPCMNITLLLMIPTRSNWFNRLRKDGEDEEDPKHVVAPQAMSSGQKWIDLVWNGYNNASVWYRYSMIVQDTCSISWYFIKSLWWQ